MRKNTVLIAAIMFMFVFSLQIAGPASAASLKKIDQGSFTFKDSKNNVDTFKWTAYQKGTNYVEITGYASYPKSKIGIYYYMYLQKTSSTKIKMTGKVTVKNLKTGAQKSKDLGTYYDSTKLTAVQYYLKEFKPALKKIVTSTKL